MADTKASLQQEARDYIEGALQNGIPLRDIEEPLGLGMAIRAKWGKHAGLREAAGYSWVTALAASNA